MLYLFTIQKPGDEIVDVDFPLGHDVLDRSGALDVKKEVAAKCPQNVKAKNLPKPKVPQILHFFYLSLQIASTLWTCTSLDETYRRDLVAALGSSQRRDVWRERKRTESDRDLKPFWSSKKLSTPSANPQKQLQRPSLA